MAYYRNTPHDTDGMPPGIPYIIGNEAAERFSFYGMKTILVVFMTKYLHYMVDGNAGTAISDAQAREYYHLFVTATYFSLFWDRCCRTSMLESTARYFGSRLFTAWAMARWH